MNRDREGRYQSTMSMDGRWTALCVLDGSSAPLVFGGTKDRENAPDPMVRLDAAFANFKCRRRDPIPVRMPYYLL